MQNNIRVIPLVILLAGVAACSSINVMQEKLRIRDEVIAASKSAIACTDKLKTVPKYAPYYAKLALDPRIPPTPEQLADETHIDAESMQLGMEWYEDSQNCSSLTAEKFGRIDPGLGAYMVRAQADGVALLTEVMTTKPTYGYINTRIKQLHEKRMADARHWAADLDNRLQRKKAEQDAATAENKRMFMSALGTVTEVAAAVLVASVEVLAARQTALAQAQQRYVLVTPAYRPVQITNTTCTYNRPILQCNQVSY